MNELVVYMNIESNYIVKKTNNLLKQFLIIIINDNYSGVFCEK